jgi:hypothetical protein
MLTIVLLVASAAGQLDRECWFLRGDEAHTCTLRNMREALAGVVPNADGLRAVTRDLKRGVYRRR